MTAARWRPRLAATLNVIADASPAFADEWWIIGSAAAALAGAEIADVRDVDLLLSERDAEALLSRWQDAPKLAVRPSDDFRSAVFARFGHARLPIEVMGGFEMRVRDQWRAVKPLSRIRHGDVYAPSAAEQIVLYQAMNRLKDAARIRALTALAAFKSPPQCQ
jgi:hypothetical protein